MSQFPKIHVHKKIVTFEEYMESVGEISHLSLLEKLRLQKGLDQKSKILGHHASGLLVE